MNMEFDFEITSGKVNLSDPCYGAELNWCGFFNIPARNGNWHVEVEHTNRRVKSWKAYHDHAKTDGLPISRLYPVDSGQFGIFDSEIYVDPGEHNKPGFYRECCDTTFTRNSCGVVSNRGFVSSSGYGNSIYIGKAVYDENKDLVSFEIVFIRDNDDEYDYDNE
jgi:hypothetical protein